jgi:sortase A
VRIRLAHTLLAAGGLCTSTGVAMVLFAEYQQRVSSREWHDVAVAHPAAPREMPPGVVARMTFDRLRREVFVFDDGDPGNLKSGPVWLRMTRAFGQGGNTVIAGHRDTHFRFLKDARAGDIFTVEDGVSQRRYRITDMQVVKPSDRELLAPTSKQVVTLVTCYPFYGMGRATRRMIIRAEPVNQLAASAHEMNR